jgi:Fe2+ or Zn2+ uptake regulation protein
MHEPTHLKDAGLKSTLPRLKVLNLFETGKERHLGAEEVYKLLLASGDDVGLATVYRVLTQFEQAGLLITLRAESQCSNSIRASTTTTSSACNVITSKNFTMQLSKRDRRKSLPSSASPSKTILFTFTRIASNQNVRIKIKAS